MIISQGFKINLDIYLEYALPIEIFQTIFL